MLNPSDAKSIRRRLLLTAASAYRQRERMVRRRLGLLWLAILLVAVLFAVPQSWLDWSRGGNSPRPETAPSAAGSREGPTSAPAFASRETVDRRSALEVAGRVIRGDGVPVEGALIYCVPYGSVPLAISLLGDPPPRAHPIATSAADGTFRISSEFVPGVVVAHSPVLGFGFSRSDRLQDSIIIEAAATKRIHVRARDLTPIGAARLQLRRLPFRWSRDLATEIAEHDPDRRALACIEAYDVTSAPNGDVAITGATEGVFAIRGEAVGLPRLEAVVVLASEKPAWIHWGGLATVRGTVVDATSGNGVKGAHVRIMSPEATWLPWSAVERSDSDGRFVLQSPCGLSESPGVQLRVEAPGFGTALESIADFSAGRDVSVTVTLGASGRIRGRVVASDELPVSSASVWLRTTPGNVPLGHTSTDSAGLFEFADVASDRPYRLTVRAEGFADAYVDAPEVGALPATIVLRSGGSIRMRFVDHGQTPLASTRAVVRYRLEIGDAASTAPWETQEVDIASTPLVRVRSPGVHTLHVEVSDRAPCVISRVEVPSGSETTVNVELRQGAAIRGRLVSARAKAPLPGAQIALLTPRGSGGMPGEVTGYVASAGADGTFELRGVPSGKQDLRAYDGVMTGAWREQLHAIHVPEDQAEVDVGDLEIAALSTIRGRVRSASPSAEMLSVVLMDLQGVELVERPIAADGLFEFQRVVAGQYRIALKVARPTPCLVQQQWITLAPEEDANVEFTWGSGTILVRLRRHGGGSFEGQWHAFLQDLATMTERSRLAIDASGEFQIPGIAPGQYLLLVRDHAEGATSRVTRTVSVNIGVTRVEIDLSGASAVIDVHSRDEKPVVDASVYYRVAGVPMVKGHLAGRTDAKGSLVAHDLDPGDYWLSVTATGYEELPRTRLRITRGAESRVGIILPRQASIDVAAATFDGMPVNHGDVAVRTRSLECAKTFTSTLGTQGTARIERLGAGRYEMVVSGGKELFPAHRELELTEGQVTSQRFTLYPLAELRVRATDHDGVPLASAAVGITSDGVEGNLSDWINRGWIRSSTGSARTGPLGEVLLSGVPAASLRISVENGLATTVSLKRDEKREVTVSAQ